MPAQWQIALAVLAGFGIGTLCTYLACRITSGSEGGRREATEETVGADADGQASGAPQGRPQQTQAARGEQREQREQEARRPWP